MKPRRREGLEALAKADLGEEVTTLAVEGAEVVVGV
jgi:hypothetical protein